jgi:hypothetical protein
VDIVSPKVLSGGVYQPVTPAVMGQKFRAGVYTYTLSRVDNYLGSGLGLEGTPGHTLLTFAPPLKSPLAAGGAIAILATTNGGTSAPAYNTYAYEGNAVSIATTLSGAGCGATGAAFYPVGATVTATQATTDALSTLQGKSIPFAGTITWPPTSGGYQNSGTPDHVSFAAGGAAYCPTFGSSPFAVIGSKPVANGTAGSSPCVGGNTYYIDGTETASYATSNATLALVPDGAVVCTRSELQNAAYNTHGCDGDTGSSVSRQQALQELQNAEEYYGTNGDCFYGVNGWLSGDCNPPIGTFAENSPVVVVLSLHVSANWQL